MGGVDDYRWKLLETFDERPVGGCLMSIKEAGARQQQRTLTDGTDPFRRRCHLLQIVEIRGFRMQHHLLQGVRSTTRYPQNIQVRSHCEPRMACEPPSLFPTHVPSCSH